MTTLYHRQLAHIFNRPTTEPAWYWSEHWEEGIFEDEDPLSAFVFIEALLQNPALALAPYSDDEVTLGLEFVFNDAISNLACDFKTAPLYGYQQLTFLNRNKPYSIWQPIPFKAK